MARGSSRSLWIAGAALVIALLAAAAVLVVGTTRHGSGPSVSRGEAIFQSGGDANGVPIPRSGGTTNGGMMGGGGSGGGGMMSAGCATCHGSGGHGRTTPAFSAPNITYSNLTDSQGMLQPDGTRGLTYTDATLRMAVTQGLDPEGSRLESPMPQWQLTGPEWADLLAYLKILD